MVADQMKAPLHPRGSIFSFCSWSFLSLVAMLNCAHLAYDDGFHNSGDTLIRDRLYLTPCPSTYLLPCDNVLGHYTVTRLSAAVFTQPVSKPLALPD